MFISAFPMGAVLNYCKALEVHDLANYDNMYNVTHTQNINYDISISTYTYDILGYAFALKSGSGARQISDRY